MSIPVNFKLRFKKEYDAKRGQMVDNKRFVGQNNTDKENIFIVAVYCTFALFRCSGSRYALTVVSAYNRFPWEMFYRVQYSVVIAFLCYTTIRLYTLMFGG